MQCVCMYACMMYGGYAIGHSDSEHWSLAYNIRNSHVPTHSADLFEIFIVLGFAFVCLLAFIHFAREMIRKIRIFFSHNHIQ